MSSRLTFIFVLLCGVLLYELPSLLTLAKLGWEPIPPVLVADQNLYLNLSAIQHVSATEVVNPWYGTHVLAVDVPHLIFPVTFVLFRMMHAAFSSWTTAMLVWTALWMALTYIAAVFCIESLFPDSDRSLTAAAGLGLLVLQSPLIYIAQLMQMMRGGPFFTVPLPNLRFAIPQVIAPAVLAYWGLQARALKRFSVFYFLGMALLQFLVCASFPYFLPVLALGTGITLVLHGFQKNAVGWTWRKVLAFAALCGTMDIAYVLWAGLGKSHANVHLSLQFRPEMILPAIRPYMLLLVIAAGLALVSKAAPSTKFTVAGLALASALFGFADVFFPPETQMLQHPNYFIGIVTWLALSVALWPFLGKLASGRSRAAILGILLIIGIWEAFSSFRMMLAVNVFQRNVVSELEQMRLGERDLVIAPSRFSDDISSWIPLASRARVLFTNDGENILSATDTRTLQTTRQALYLMFSGMTPASLDLRTRDNSSDSEIHPLLQQTDRTLADSRSQEDRVRLRRLLNERMAPVFSELLNHPATSENILNGYERIIVIDKSTDSIFEKSAISKWLVVQQAYEHNGVSIYVCHTRSNAERATVAPTGPAYGAMTR